MNTSGIPEPIPQVEVSPEDLARLYAAQSYPARSSARTKIIGAILVAGIGVGASAMSCVGQSFSLRQARALEGIELQLQQLQQRCGR